MRGPMARLPGFYYEQMSRPHGRRAAWAARWMNVGNQIINRQAVHRLGAQPGERVLEAGFGGGMGLRLLLAAGVSVVGIDPSPAMIGYCSDRFSADVTSGRLRMMAGTAEGLPLKDNSVDGAIAVNTIYFWDDPGRGMSEICRVLRPGRRLVVATSSAWPCRFFGFHNQGMFIPDPSKLLALADAAGFSEATIEHKANLGGTQLFVCSAG